MRSLTLWIGAALVFQPFYPEKIRVIPLLLQTLRHWLQHSDRFDSPNSALLHTRAKR
jgi:hypothetical protein